MIPLFFRKMDRSLIPRRLPGGPFPPPRRSYTLDGFGRLPLLLPERDALNLKALCPGPISPFGPGVFISSPGSCPGFSFGSPLLDAGGAGKRVSSHPRNTAPARSSPDFLRLEKSCTEVLGAIASISPSTRRRILCAASRESLSALVSSTCTGFPVGRNHPSIR